jgi:hypothetical protein
MVLLAAVWNSRVNLLDSEQESTERFRIALLCLAVNMDKLRVFE